MRLEEAVQGGRFENLKNEGSEVAEHHVTVLAAQHTSEANQGAEAAAIEEIDLRKIQDNMLRLEHELVDGDLQGLYFIADDDTAVASQDCDVSNARVLNFEFHRSAASHAKCQRFYLSFVERARKATSTTAGRLNWSSIPRKRGRAALQSQKSRQDAGATKDDERESRVAHRHRSSCDRAVSHHIQSNENQTQQLHFKRKLP